MKPLIFVFPGLGAQWAGMGQALLKSDPVFADAVAELDPLFVAAGEPPPGELLRLADPALIDRSDYSHLQTFSYQTALARSLIRRGIVPTGVIGHSSGEVAAAVTAGILTPAAAVELVVAHLALIRAVAGQGEMLFVALPPERAAELASARPGLEIAACNSRNSVVFAGSAEQLAQLTVELGANQVFCRSLRTSIAFHSQILDPHLDRFSAAIAKLATAPSRYSYYSSLTGGPFAGPWDAAYWRRHIRQPILFSQAVATILSTDAAVDFLEITPHPTLALGLRADLAGYGAAGRVFAPLEQGCDEPARLATLADELAAAPAPAAREETAAATSPREALVAELTRQLGRNPDLEEEASWSELGLTSLQLMELAQRLGARLGRRISPASFFLHPLPAAFLRFLEAAPPPSVRRGAPQAAAGTPVAIIGMAFRFPPDLDSPGRLSAFLRSGANAVTAAPADRPELAGESAAFLQPLPIGFDARYFHISAAEAADLDPQQRLLLEVSCQALESARIAPGSLRGANVGVFLGISTDDFKELGQRRPIDSPYLATGAMFNTASGRLSYFHDFRGPALSIDTACSSSLVALHQAVRALRQGECELALAGGVNLILSRRLFDSMRTLGALSPTQSCKPFAAAADGYARGEGCALLVLKPLAAAQAAGDPILATIRGSAVNQDGRSNGLTAPNGAAQSDLIGRALADAGLDYDAVGLIETHGTGTPLGDPIEIGALTAAFAARDPALPPILLGALKSQFGHLEACAGVAGVIKTILALQSGEVPGICHLTPPSSQIDWQHIPFRASPDPQRWPVDRPRIAGVSAFGFSGTNAHLLLEAPPPVPAPQAAAAVPPWLFAISARSEGSLRALARRYREEMQAGTLNCDHHLAFSQLTTRDHHPYRFATLVEDAEQLDARLERFLAGEGAPRVASNRGQLAMLLPGQGTQYSAMGAELHQTYPSFRAAVDDCAARCAAQGFPILPVLCPASAADRARIDESPFAQLAYLCFAWGAFALWRSFGVTPDLLIGHSLGEYVAATLAGALDLDTAIRLIVKRGELTAALPVQGRMATVMAARDRVEAMLAEFPGLDLAVINGPAQLVVAGAEAELADFCRRLESEGIDCTQLAIHFASHCRLIEPALEPFAAFCAEITHRPPRIPVISNLSGEPFAAGEGFSADYWCQHLRQPVDFGRGLASAVRLGVTEFIELGPSSVLTSLVRSAGPPPGTGLMQTASRTRPGLTPLFESLRELYLRGFAVAWPEVFAPFAPRKRALPLYPFEHQLFPLPGGAPPMTVPAPPANPSTLSTPAGTSAVAASLAALHRIVQQITWKEPAELDPQANLFELGLDSLMLVQIRQQIAKEFDINIPLGDFYESFDTLGKLAGHLAAAAPPPAALAPAPVSTAAAPPVAPASDSPDLVELCARQLETLRELCHRQLDLLGTTAAVAPPAAGPEAGEATATPKFNFRSMRLTPDQLSADQQRFIADFATDFNRKTAGSKARAARYRRVLADWINSLGYKQSLKELVYPIVAAHSQGAHFVDIDGNTYIDLAMGYGVTFLGHRPQEVVAALREQLESGFELGPQSQLAGEVAELISELTGVERVAFCNTGSEAVMVALRLSRAVTGRDRVVIFGNSYHGTFDGVLATAVDGTTYPTATGIPRKMVEDVQILTYGDSAAFEQIRRQAGTLAAVLVEPVQSRNPTLVPVEFLRQLRALTRELEVPLIFDETITGFRMHPGGAQAIFGVRADLVIYGKAIGGGLPLSVVAGSARYLDAIDGGDWQFGDDSHPGDELTFFGGTYVKHPLALAAARAALTRIRAEGPALQARVGALLDDLAQRLNAFFATAKVPVKLAHYGSMFRFEGQGKYSLALDPIEMDLFFHLLMEQGIYTWERRICFLSAAHSAADIDRVVAAVEQAVARLRAGGFAFAHAGAGPAAAAPASAPLTSAQQRLLVYDQLSAEKTLYNLPLAYQLDGPLDLQRLEAAIAALLPRHPALGARFLFANDRPCQLFDAERSLRLERRAAAGRPIAELIAEFVRPFDLAEELLVRAALFTLGEDRHLLVFDFHHLVADGLALSLLVQEVMAGYAGQPLPAIPPHFAAFVAAEGSYPDSPAATADRTFWLQAFAEPVPPLALPTDFPRPAEQDHRGDNLFFDLPTATTAALKGAAGSAGVSLFALLLAGYGALLSRLSGEARLAIGIPVDARPAGWERSVGMFANTLALPLQIDDTLPFRDLARQVQKDFLRAYEHQAYPFDKLLQDLDVPRDLGRNPLFDTMFIFEKGQDRLLQLPGLVCTPVPYNKPTAMFDLTFEAIEADGELHCRLEYATALFRRETMERLAGRLVRLLTALASEPRTAPAAIELLDEDEVQRLAALNRTTRPFAATATIPGLWARQLAANPAATALVFAGQEFSRAWLDQESNRIARALTALVAPQPDERVALLSERSPQAVAALLGILKAGAAYVPIAPDFPAERRNAILAGSDARALVASRHQCDAWSAACGRPLLVIEECAGADDAPLASPTLDAGNLAYIMFTSGSTGAPKGVMISHRNVVAMTDNLPQVYGIDESDTLLAVTTFTFDISVLEIFCCLLVGARIVLASDDDNLAITPLATLLREAGVTAFQTTPSRLKLMLELSGEEAVLGGLRTLLIGGEAFPADLFARLRHARPQIFNVYGPTETTIWSTSTRINGKERPSIGRPLCNEQVYILDRRLRPVPPGTVGELYIGGAGVGRGYLGMAELTARKFVPDPFGAPEGRLYATGDLARLQEDGELEFLGRGDDQIKLRGYRIELQEIENCLTTHPALLQAAVKTIREPASGEVRDLAACYTLRGGATPPSVEELREHLGRWLPPYMLPASFQRLERMPLNPSGKIDRKALPAAAPQDGPAVVTAVPAECAPLATIFAQVLGVATVGADDNFFTLGGDSIRAILVAARARDAGMALDVRQIFAHPTLRELAAQLAIHAPAPLPAGASPAPEPARRDRVLPLTPMQEGMLFHTLLDGDAEAYVNQALFRLDCELDPERFAATWQELTDRHAMLRTRFVPQGDGAPSQVILAAHRAELRQEELNQDNTSDPESALLELARAERARLVRVEAAPPIAIVLIRRGPRDWQVLWTFHHILFDGWSIALLLREFVSRYQGGELEPLRGDFPDYLAWLGRRDELPTLAYWEERLAGAQPPRFFPTTAGVGYRQQQLDLGLDAAIFQRLAGLARKEGLTLNALLQAAWATTLHSAGGDDDLLFGVTVSGRPPELPGVTGMVGLFINTLPVRAQLPAAPTTLAELARTLQAANLAAGPHQHLSLAALQARIGHPLFDHLLIFENYPLADGVAELFGTGLETSPVTAVDYFEHTHYPLEVILFAQQELAVTFRFNAAQVAVQQIEELAEGFLAILTAAAAEPARTLRALCGDRPRLAFAPAAAAPEAASSPPAGAPPGVNETLLCALFAQVLELPMVRRDDHFFTCGGHSLKVVRLAGRIWEELGIQVPLRLIYTHPTPRTLAAALALPSAATVLDLQPGPTAEHYPLAEGQKGLWLTQQLQADSCAYNTVGSYRLHGPLDPAALATALAGCAARHEALRTSFQLHQGEPCQTILPTMTDLLTTVDLRGDTDPEQTAREAILTQLRTPFDLTRAPLFRATLFQLDEKEQILALVFHHLISDGWSDTVLARELAQGYAAAVRGESAELPPPALHYRDFARAQQRYLAGDASAADRRYWGATLAGELPQLDLFADFPRPAVRAGRGARHRFDLAEQAKGIRQLARQARVTPFVVLQALLKLLIYALADAEESIIGVPSANRSHPATHDLVGYFLNLLPIRSRLRGEQSFSSLLDELQQQTLAAFEHQDYPFSSLVADLGLPRSRNRHPLFDVLLIFHNNRPLVLELPGIDCEPFFEDSVSCRFDLDFELFDDEPLSGFIEYDCELYRPETVATLASALARLAAVASGAPETPLRELAQEITRNLGCDDADFLAELNRIGDDC
ncbi:glutamate-1-semialdehyde aminotransferase [Desulfuromonas sp. DDH964]|uniref:hybrid non-ribosomal peptide synthetase/type I polyketide synthase n=1 Tax=Desulfuromonas sp. DDH964 TaxID=1823759 RepID=UPI00078DC602|nr:hybrid non-ribosomal peptide synthetase/type I polyketide synthase [Desulfuromonas sp. DDH964]AMV71109.1 glutamate-1-semialdehyde aminotransferase [Desulfuromonas sp. DDH964]